jgi:rhamnosyltransferase
MLLCYRNKTNETPRIDNKFTHTLRIPVSPVVPSQTIKASVIIPTKNPGLRFRAVLEAIRNQQTEWPFEIIVVDSGSTDGTLEFLREQPEVKVLEIPPRQFGHGRTRNLGISHAQGEFCALLTHDARPVNPDWLANFVVAIEQDSEIAGVFGPHLAYPGHCDFVKRDLEQHFSGFMDHPLVVSRATDPARFEADQGWRQFLHFYSDNNSCLRRAVWEQIPYPDVEFAEDQIWALKIIEANWKKAFVPDAAVFHSHDYGPLERLRRAFDESFAYRQLFGYRLGGGPIRTIHSSIGLSLQDWKWGRAHNLRFPQIARRILYDVATAVGHSLGSRGDWLPEFLRVRLSEDKRLFYSVR